MLLHVCTCRFIYYNSNGTTAVRREEVHIKLFQVLCKVDVPPTWFRPPRSSPMVHVGNVRGAGLSVPPFIILPRAAKMRDQLRGGTKMSQAGSPPSSHRDRKSETRPAEMTGMAKTRHDDTTTRPSGAVTSALPSLILAEAGERAHRRDKS